MDFGLVKRVVNVAGSVKEPQHIQVLKLKRLGKKTLPFIAKQEM